MKSTTIEITTRQDQMNQEPAAQTQVELVRELLDAELCAVGGGAGDVVLG